MPRITEAHKKESIVSFARDALNVLHANLDLDDLTKGEVLPPLTGDAAIQAGVVPWAGPGYMEFPWIFHDGWYYYMHKSVANIDVLGSPELRVKRQNFRLGNTDYFKDQPKGNRIREGAWIYKEGMLRDGACVYGGYKIDGFNVQLYEKTAF